MRTIYTAKTVYKFEELDTNAQDKAVEELRDINIDHNWWNFKYEDASEIGLKITGFNLDHNTISGELTDYPDYVANKILREHGDATDTYQLAYDFMRSMAYYFDAGMAADDWESKEEAQEILGDTFVEENGDEFEHALLEEYLSLLKNEFEYLTSREAIVEMIKANEYEFDKNGKSV